MAEDVGALIEAVRAHPGVRAKAEIGLVREVFGDCDWLAGPGDDGAVVMHEGSALVVGGEAILPGFVAADPYGAGVAAVSTNLNDLAAMGAWPLALVDTVTGPRPVVRRVLEGMRWAAALYDVPVVGGHLTAHRGAAQPVGVRAGPGGPAAVRPRGGTGPVAGRRGVPRRADARGLPVLPLLRRARRPARR